MLTRQCVLMTPTNHPQQHEYINYNLEGIRVVMQKFVSKAWEFHRMTTLLLQLPPPSLVVLLAVNLFFLISKCKRKEIIIKKNTT